MEAKKNLCAMIPAELHAKVVAEKERLELSTLGECGTDTQRTLRRRKNDYGSNQNPGIPNL